MRLKSVGLFALPIFGWMTSTLFQTSRQIFLIFFENVIPRLWRFIWYLLQKSTKHKTFRKSFRKFLFTRLRDTIICRNMLFNCGRRCTLFIFHGSEQLQLFEFVTQTSLLTFDFYEFLMTNQSLSVIHRKVKENEWNALFKARIKMATICVINTR